MNKRMKKGYLSKALGRGAQENAFKNSAGDENLGNITPRDVLIDFQKLKSNGTNITSTFIKSSLRPAHAGQKFQGYH